MSIPTRHRDALLQQEQGRLTLTRHPDGCLLVYPRSVWEEKREQIARNVSHSPLKSGEPCNSTLMGWARG
jgi:DNA-binding transcriptional regulator/RsmH inhibitor MraZ